MCGCSKDFDKLNFRFLTLLLTYLYLFLTNIFMCANVRPYFYLYGYQISLKQFLMIYYRLYRYTWHYCDILQYVCSPLNKMNTYDTRFCLALIIPVSFSGRGQTQGSNKLAPFHTVRFVDHHHLDIV